MELPACWQCDAERAGKSLFCPRCGTLQTSGGDYFHSLGVERKLSLDAADLQKRFYEQSRKLHPDLYSRKSEQERANSLEVTAVLNDAYRTLRDPVTRAEYLLKQEGFDIGEQRGKDVPSELLEEVFELNMALEELRHGDKDAVAPLREAEAKFSLMRENIDGEVQALFPQFDESGNREVLQQIRALLNRRRYIRNLIAEVEKELACFR